MGKYDRLMIDHHVRHAHAQTRSIDACQIKFERCHGFLESDINGRFTGDAVGRVIQLQFELVVANIDGFIPGIGIRGSYGFQDKKEKKKNEGSHDDKFVKRNIVR